MLRENGQSRRYSGADAATTARLAAEDELALRRAASLVGEDSPLRPGFGANGRPMAEFGVALGRLGDAFSQIKGTLQQLEEKLDGLTGGIGKTAKNVDSIHDRLDIENARMAGLDGRMAELEAKNAATLDAIQSRITLLSRQVAFALGMAMTMGALAVAALFVR